jgi:hypothetical protein
MTSNNMLIFHFRMQNLWDGALGTISRLLVGKSAIEILAGVQERHVAEL